MRAWLLALAVFLGHASGWASGLAGGLVPVPALSARVVDTVGLLDAGSRARIEEQLGALERDKGAQVAFLIVGSTQPEDIASYANRVGNTWKIGRHGVGDGVLLVVARDDRKVRIEVAKTLEGAIPDLAARQIVRDLISPAFKAGDYAGGLERGVDALIARIQGEGLPQPARAAEDDGGPQLEELMIFFFVAVPVISAVLSGMFGRKLGALFTGGVAGGVAGWVTHSVLLGLVAGVVALVLVGVFGLGAAARRVGRARGGRWSHGGGWSAGSGGWSAGGSGGGSGGFGGFSSGGGGDFGGGGAGGDWCSWTSTRMHRHGRPRR